MVLQLHWLTTPKWGSCIKKTYKYQDFQILKTGVKRMKRIIILGVIFLLLSTLVLAQSDETAVVRQLNERLERNKAELLKEIKDSTAKNEQVIKESIDANFAVLDERIQGFFKSATRDFAVIIVAGYLMAFTFSQIIRLKIEQKRRTSQIERALALEQKVVTLEDRAKKLMINIKKLDTLEKQLGQRIGGYKKDLKPRPFFNIKIIGWSILMLLFGGLGTLLLRSFLVVT